MTKLTSARAMMRAMRGAMRRNEGNPVIVIHPCLPPLTVPPRAASLPPPGPPARPQPASRSESPWGYRLYPPIHDAPIIPHRPSPELPRPTPRATVRAVHDQLIVPSQPAYGVSERMEDEGNIIDLEVVCRDGYGHGVVSWLASDHRQPPSKNPTTVIWRQPDLPMIPTM
jgi:hypothetical protein